MPQECVMASVKDSRPIADRNLLALMNFAHRGAWLAEQVDMQPARSV